MCKKKKKAKAVHACLVELSYAERIFDLSQAAYKLLRYLHSVSWVCCLLGPSPASDAGYRGSQRGDSHTFLFVRLCRVVLGGECVRRRRSTWASTTSKPEGERGKTGSESESWRKENETNGVVVGEASPGGH